MKKPVYHKTFGEQIRHLRESSGLTLRCLSKKVQMDPSLLAKIEKNKRKPTKHFIRNIAEIFNVNEKLLLNNFLSDQIAYKILEEDAESAILHVAEEKVAYYRSLK